MCGSRSRPDTIWRLKVPSINRTSDRGKSQRHRIIVPTPSPTKCSLSQPQTLYLPSFIFFTPYHCLSVNIRERVSISHSLSVYLSSSVRPPVSLALPHPFPTKHIYTYIYLFTTLAATETLYIYILLLLSRFQT